VDKGAAFFVTRPSLAKKKGTSMWMAADTDVDRTAKTSSTIVDPL
jgi:hypothetical protein